MYKSKREGLEETSEQQPGRQQQEERDEFFLTEYETNQEEDASCH